jgi:type IV pilus assembly protein PilW
VRTFTRAARSGFTLVELLVGLAVTSIVLVAVAGGTVAIQHVYERESVVKGSVEGARLSEQLVERLVHLAGYGLPPETAFDFAPPGGTLLKDNDNVRPKVAGNPDRTQDVVSDDLAWRYRDPNYLRRGSVSGGTLTLANSATFGVPLKLGQALMVACTGGFDYAVFKTTAGATASASSVSITAYGTPFTNSTAGCLSESSPTGAPFVMLIVERRMRVKTLGSNLRPYLVLFRNLDDPTSNTDFEPVAADIENFQVTYTMNRPIDGAAVPSGAANTFGNGNWILCDEGDGDCNIVSGTRPYPTTADAAPRYTDTYTDAKRFNRNPANIRAVNIFATIRSSRQDPTQRGGLYKPQTLGNFVYVTPINDNFFRADFSTSVRVPNMLSRSFFVPPLSTVATDNLNKWGG